MKQAVELLNHAVATEIVCVLRYQYHAVVATGISSDAVKAEFAEHARKRRSTWTCCASASTSSAASPT